MKAVIYREFAALPAIEDVPDPGLEDGFTHIYKEMPAILALQLKQRQELSEQYHEH